MITVIRSFGEAQAARSAVAVVVQAFGEAEVDEWFVAGSGDHRNPQQVEPHLDTGGTSCASPTTGR